MGDHLRDAARRCGTGQGNRLCNGPGTGADHDQSCVEPFRRCRSTRQRYSYRREPDAAEHRGEPQRRPIGGGTGAERRQGERDGGADEERAGAHQHQRQAEEHDVGVGRDRAEDQRQPHDHPNE